MELSLDPGSLGLQPHPEGGWYTSTRTVGPTPEDGHDLQWLVEPGQWQAAAPAGASYALVGCVVAPGFDFADFELAP